MYLCVERGIRGWKVTSVMRIKILGSKTNAYNKADSEERPFHTVRQSSITGEFEDTYHRVTQCPFQCWPMTYVSGVYVRNSSGETITIKGRTHSCNSKREHSHSPRACPRTLWTMSVSRGINGADGATSVNTRRLGSVRRRVHSGARYSSKM